MVKMACPRLCPLFGTWTFKEEMWFLCKTAVILGDLKSGSCCCPYNGSIELCDVVTLCCFCDLAQ